MHKAFDYRTDIDGLRAIAVVAVVLHHAGASWLPGGFVGVDVFFVISGYPITSILLRELETGQFSIIGFYERRARRILPAPSWRPPATRYWGVDIAFASVASQENCDRRNDAIVRFIEDTLGIDTVILAARWPLATEGHRVPGEYGAPMILSAAGSVSSDVTGNARKMQAGLERTVAHLSAACPRSGFTQPRRCCVMAGSTCPCPPAPPARPSSTATAVHRRSCRT